MLFLTGQGGSSPEHHHQSSDASMSNTQEASLPKGFQYMDHSRIPTSPGTASCAHSVESDDTSSSVQCVSNLQFSWPLRQYENGKAEMYNKSSFTEDGPFRFVSTVSFLNSKNSSEQGLKLSEGIFRSSCSCENCKIRANSKVPSFEFSSSQFMEDLRKRMIADPESSAFRICSPLFWKLKKSRCLHCAVCNRQFSQHSNLVTHMRIHTGEKPFRCTICELSFSQSSNLKRHLRTHTGEKKFQCNICGRKCSRKTTLLAHIKTHERKNFAP